MSLRKNPARNIVGERVREARLRLDPSLTQDELSGRLASKGIPLDRCAVAKIELGLRCAFDYEVKALASVLNVDANWLLGIKSSGDSAMSAAKKKARS